MATLRGLELMRFCSLLQHSMVNKAGIVLPSASLSRGAILLNSLKIKPPIADFYTLLGGFRGVKPPNIKPPFDFLTPKGTDAEGGFENGTTYLS